MVVKVVDTQGAGFYCLQMGDGDQSALSSGRRPPAGGGADLPPRMRQATHFSRPQCPQLSQRVGRGSMNTLVPKAPPLE